MTVPNPGTADVWRYWVAPSISNPASGNTGTANYARYWIPAGVFVAAPAASGGATGYMTTNRGWWGP